MSVQETVKVSAILGGLRLTVPFLSAYKSHPGARNASETFAAEAIADFGQVTRPVTSQAVHACDGGGGIRQCFAALHIMPESRRRQS